MVHIILIRVTLLDADTFAVKVSKTPNALPKRLRRTKSHDNDKEISETFDIESRTGICV